MPRWRNWSGKLASRPASLQFLRSEADAVSLAREVTASGGHLRVQGAAHSHARLLPNDDGVIADIGGLVGIVSVDRERERAWIWGGSRIHALGNALQLHGLAFANQGDIDEQTIAGATATGTHGTGRTLKNFSAAVTGMRLVLADGELLDVDGDRNADVWRAARLHLGAFGIVTRLELKLRPCYRLKEQSWEAPLEVLLADTARHVEAHRHFEFFWYPREDRGRAKAIDETDDPPVYPVGPEGSRTAWSHEVLPNHRPVPHTEMEYSVPAERGIECMRAIAELLRTEFTSVAWPVEYRTLAADDVWMSTAYGRETVTISVHLGVDEDDEPFFRACEEIFLAHDGRPHWGKVHYLDGDRLAELHPRWLDWWRVRDGVDPKGTFLNDYLRGLRPA